MLKTYWCLILILLSFETGSLGVVNFEIVKVDDIITYIKNGIKCENIVQEFITRIENYNNKLSKINAVISVNPRTFDEARALDTFYTNTGKLKGSLHCVPILIKDNIDVEGNPTRAGSIVLNASYPKTDAPLVRDLKAAGGIVIAKANMDTFAIGGASASEVAGVVKNPYGLEIASPAGSSCGNGAGGAAVFGVIGVGSDTSGSVILPSANANLIGMNLAKDKIDMAGVFPLSPFCDRAGPMVRYAEDLAKMLDILDTSIPESRKPFYTSSEVLNENGLEGLKIGYLQLAYRSEDLANGALTWDPTLEIRALFDTMLFNLAKGGANLKSCAKFTHDDLFFLENVRVINEARMMTSCLANDVDKYLRGVTEDSPYHTADQLVESGLLPPQMGVPLSIAVTQRELCSSSLSDYTFARNYYRQLFMEPLFECADIIITLLSDAFPDVRKGSMGPAGIGYLFGHPQMSFPLGFSQPKPGAPKGLPVAAFVTTKPGNEHLVVRMAYAYQKKYGSGVVLPESVPPPPKQSGGHSLKVNTPIIIFILMIVFASGIGLLNLHVQY